MVRLPFQRFWDTGLPQSRQSLTAHMAPVSAAEKAALDAFFKGKRGERKLIEPVAEALISYFAGKGTTLPELSTVRPVDPTRVADFQDECAVRPRLLGPTDAPDLERWLIPKPVCVLHTEPCGMCAAPAVLYRAVAASVVGTVV